MFFDSKKGSSTPSKLHIPTISFLYAFLFITDLIIHHSPTSYDMSLPSVPSFYIYSISLPLSLDAAIFSLSVPLPLEMRFGRLDLVARIGDDKDEWWGRYMSGRR